MIVVRAEGWPLETASNERRRVDAILGLVADGRTDKEIARLLMISVPTVRKHLQRFYRAHGLHSRTSAALSWMHPSGDPSTGAGKARPSRLRLSPAITPAPGPGFGKEPEPFPPSRLPLDPMAFRQILGYLPAGVTIMTTTLGSRQHGMTASAFCSISLDPLLVMVSVARRARMHRLVTTSGVFAINMLGEEDEALG